MTNLPPNQIPTYPPKVEGATPEETRAAFLQHEVAHRETAERAVLLEEKEAYQYYARYAWPESAGPQPRFENWDFTTTYFDVPEPGNSGKTHRITVHSTSSPLKPQIDWSYIPPTASGWRIVGVQFNHRGAGEHSNPAGVGTVDMFVAWECPVPSTGKGDWVFEELFPPRR